MDLWSTFLIGIASGIAVAILAMVIRKFFGRTEEGSTLKLNRRTLGALTLGIIMIATVAAMIVLALQGMEIPTTLYLIFFISGIWFYMLV